MKKISVIEKDNKIRIPDEMLKELGINHYEKVLIEKQDNNSIFIKKP